MRLFKTIKELGDSGYIFRITDNGGATLDRYTVLFCDGDYLSLSENGAGVSMWNEGDIVQHLQEAVEDGTQLDCQLGDLSPELRDHILWRVNQAWQDALESIEKRALVNYVAPSREQSEVNEGTHDSAGKGIYSAGAGFCIRMDSDDAADDRGPYMTPAEALAATLPDDYSLSGPEYHSTANPGSLKRTPGYRAALKRLERQIAKEETA